MPYRVIEFLILITAVLALAGWWVLMPKASIPLGTDAIIPSAGSEQVTPIPRQLVLDQAMVTLGRQLFHDPRLSRDNSVSCASCHDLQRGGDDARPHSIGIDGSIGELNTPTVFNSGFNFRQFWDGRAITLEEQAAGPVHNPIEMDSSWEQVLGKLRDDSVYPAAFAAIWLDGIQASHIQAALAEFQRSLITPDAPFDRFLRGDETALQGEAHRGWDLFRNLGCVSCHQGVNIGGNMFANMGMMGDYFGDLDRPLKSSDMGRYNVTGRESDRYLFKVPGLRNVARTAPYFHDGSVPTLESAVDLMARYQIGVVLDAPDRDALIAFLHSLNGVLLEDDL